MFFKSNFSYSDSNKSYSDLLLELDSGNIESIFFYPRKREIDVLYKNGNKEKVPILYNDQLILEKASENNVDITINNSRKESSAASGTPATSSKRVSTSSIVRNLDLLLPKPKALEASLEVLLNIKNIAIKNIKKRPTDVKELATEDSFLLLLTVRSTLFSDAFSRIS